MKSFTSRVLAVGALGLALVLSGCSNGSVSGGTATTGATSSALTHVTLGLFPSSAQAAFQVAIDQGIFKDEGLDLELVVGQGSAAQLPALSSGSLDFMLASPITPLLATTQGLDIKIVSGYARNNPDVVDDSTVVVAGKDSPIHSAKDLAGKTVSVNALGSVGEMGIKEAVEKDGGDPSTIKFVQLGLSEVPAQVAAGQIDAGMTGSPFIQQVLDKGGRVVSDFITASGLGGSELVIASSGNLISKDPAKVKAFVAAMGKMATYLNEHHQAIIEMMPKVLGIPAAVAAKSQFMIWDSTIHQDALGTFATLMLKFGIVKKLPDVNATVWTP
jgi:NitT/TauT family transport system substrate-binding protein